MSLRSTFRTDKTSEVEGVWQEIGVNDHNGEPIRVKISRMSASNKRYTKMLNRVTKPHQAAIQNDALDNDLARKMLREVFIETVLLDWENLSKSEVTGNPEDTDALPFNKENANKLFDEMPDLYDELESRAQRAASFREQEIEENAGN